MKRSRRRWRRVLLDACACFLIPVYTLLFAGSMQWFSTNFSVIAVTGRDHYRGFVYWGVMAGVYFLVSLGAIARTLPRRWSRWSMYVLSVSACLCLGYALLIPYLPDYFPQYAQLHVLLAFTASVLLMLALLLALVCCRRQAGGYDQLLWAWGAVAAGSGVLFVVAGMVSSALEVYFTITCALLTRKLLLTRRKV